MSERLIPRARGTGAAVVWRVPSQTPTSRRTGCGFDCARRAAPLLVLEGDATPDNPS